MTKSLIIFLITMSYFVNAQNQKRYNEYMEKGKTAWGNDNKSEALQYFSKASDENPNDKTSAEFAGITAGILKDKPAVKKYISRYIINGGNDEAVYYSLAVVYKEESNFDKYIQTLKLGIGKCINKKDLQNELVNAYLLSGQTSNAITYLETLVTEYPSNSTYLLNLGILHDNSGNKSLAKSYYEKTLQSNPYEYDALYNLGAVYFNEAVELKVQVDKMDLSTYNSRGKFIEKTAIEKWKESLTYFERAYAIRNYDCDLVQVLNNIYSLLYQAKEVTQQKNAKCYDKPDVTSSDNSRMASTNSSFGKIYYDKDQWESNKVLLDGLGAIIDIFRANVAENRRNSSSSSSSDNSSSYTEGEQKKSECEEAENMDIPLGNLREKSKNDGETELKITYITEIDGWNSGVYWYDKENNDYYIKAPLYEHHYRSLEDCLRALYIYKKTTEGCITKKGKK